MTLLPTWIKEIEKRADMATPGPWRRGNAAMVWSTDWTQEIAQAKDARDADLMVASRTDIPKLIAALKIAVAALHKYQCSDCYYNRGERVCMDYGTCKAIREIEALK